MPGWVRRWQLWLSTGPAAWIVGGEVESLRKSGSTDGFTDSPSDRPWRSTSRSRTADASARLFATDCFARACHRRIARPPATRVGQGIRPHRPEASLSRVIEQSETWAGPFAGRRCPTSRLEPPSEPLVIRRGTCRHWHCCHSARLPRLRGPFSGEQRLRVDQRHRVQGRRCESGALASPGQRCTTR